MQCTHLEDTKLGQLEKNETNQKHSCSRYTLFSRQQNEKAGDKTADCENLI